MSGMESLGRLNNVIPVGAGQAFKMRGASVAQIVCVGNDTYTVEASNAFAGTFAALDCIKNIYYASADNGTAAWAKFTWVDTTTPLSAITIGSSGTPAALDGAAMACFHVFTSQLSDPDDYLKITVGGSGLVQVILGDLVVQRGPANLEILGS
jgi:hypothetical protein